MSTGSCDQLYLAIRIAYLEDRVDQPRASDILLHFDDSRPLSPCSRSWGSSRRTQVIFFTHHVHILELARQSLPGDLLF